ncbi:MAG: carbohydrate ABC transporter permease, partial [Lachnospiraceae bacterium]|nr:carbohydrate ABC transporter permease [Lachnospiraceae bacterium]
MDYGRLERSARIRKKAVNALTYVLLVFWAVIVLFPFYWMILTSVKSYGAYNSEYVPKFFTLSPTMQNYVDAFTAVPLGRYLVNTTIFTI